MSQGDIRYYCRLLLALILFIFILIVYKNPNSGDLCGGLGIAGLILAIDWRFLK